MYSGNIEELPQIISDREPSSVDVDESVVRIGTPLIREGIVVEKFRAMMADGALNGPRW